MTIERDDFEDLMRSAERWGGGRIVESDASLQAWMGNVLGARLLARGLTRQEARDILLDALRDYARFRRDVKNPRLFLVKRVWTKLKAHMKLRGIERPPDSEDQMPHLLDAIRRGTALMTLGPKARRCLQLLFLEQKTHEEIAAEMDHSVAGVRRLISGGMKQLREWVRQNPEE